MRARLDPRAARLGRRRGRRSELGVDGSRAGWRFTVILRVDEEVLAAAGPPRQVGGRVLTLGRGRPGQVLLTATKADGCAACRGHGRKADPARSRAPSVAGIRPERTAPTSSAWSASVWSAYARAKRPNARPSLSLLPA